MSKTENRETVSVLHLEDNCFDRELVARALLRDQLYCEFVYAATAAEFREALDHSKFDLILSDFTLPSFSGTAALTLAKAAQPEVPFLFVSGTIGEERAVETLKSGARDYVPKDHLGRLSGAIRRALQEAQQIAEREQAEEALKGAQQALALFRSLIDQTNDAIEVIDPETGRFLDVNEKACVAHGYTREEYLALTLPEMVPSLAGRSWQEIKDRLRRFGSQLIESQHRRKDGSLFPVEVSVTYIHLERDYMVAVVRDTTERKKAEEALRASEERFRELAETIQEVFWVTEPAKNRVLYVSPAYERMWGRTCQSLYAEPSSWLEAIHPDDRQRILGSATTQQASGAYDEEFRIVRPDGQVRWIRDRAFPVRNASGEVQRIVGLARDVTERRQLEEQLRQSQKMEAIGQLAGGVAHDFNNVLAAIMMQAELAGMEEKVPKTVQEGLLQIRIYAEHAANLTRQLLLFSRRQVMQPRELNLNEIVFSLAKMLQRIIGEDVRLQLRLHPAPLVTRADAGMLDQVILNLAVNARDAMAEGGHLLIETAEKSVDEAFARLNPDAAPGRYVWLSVSDNGSGMSPEVLPRIFEPFFTTKEPGKGTGLGLATVYGIVKQHRGWIEVCSQPQQGATFQIFLPAIDASSTPDATKAPRTKPRGGTETILLVEDERSVRMITRALLEQYGYRVLEASNGVEALGVWEEHRGSVALLVTDLVMPAGVSGQQLAGRLKEHNPRLNVIFTSGYSAEIAGRQLQLRSGENFLQKPFPPDELLELIRRGLDEGKD